MSSLLAQTPNPDPSTINPCPTDLSCASDLNEYFMSTILPAALMAFAGVLFLMLIIYAFKLLFGSEDDGVRGEVKAAYGYAIFGTVLVLFASVISQSFVTLGGVNPDPVASVLDTVEFIMRALIATVLIVNISVQGFRYIVAQEDGLRDTAKKRLLHGAIGAVLLILSVPIVDTFATGSIGIASTEIMGIANFLATILGFLAVTGVIVGGIMMILSVDEGLKDKAKTTIKTSLIALLVIIASYGLITLFVL